MSNGERGKGRDGRWKRRREGVGGEKGGMGGMRESRREEGGGREGGGKESVNERAIRRSRVGVD